MARLPSGARPQLLRYVLVCAAFGLVPLGMGWTHEWVRPLVWLAATLGYRMIEESGFQPAPAKGRRAAEWLFWALYLGLAGAILLPAVEFALRPRPLAPTLLVLGVASVALGTWLRYQGVKTLGAHFSTHVEVRRGHLLVDSGVYRMIRHPAYAGVMAFSLGLTLIMHAWFSAIFTVFVFWSLILTRIVIEERELARQLDGYAEYMARSSRIIPHVL